MKVIVFALTLLSLNGWSQDPTSYLNNFDAKVYSLKTKGVKDFVVDIESSKLKKQVNDQMIFGVVNELLFRVYWTANPERMDIEVIGLPDGFKEIKEELTQTFLPLMDNVLPSTMVQKFAGYKFQAGSKPKEYLATDSTGIATIPSYLLRFDAQDKLVEVVGNKAVGTLVVTPKYSKESFSDGRWVLRSSVTESSDNGQNLSIKKDLIYGTSQGISVVTGVKTETLVKPESGKAKSLNMEDTVVFKNYKINAGNALKHFLGEGSKSNL